MEVENDPLEDFPFLYERVLFHDHEVMCSECKVGYTEIGSIL